jgi:membrane protease YdiL (CAAX protease family)
MPRQSLRTARADAAAAAATAFGLLAWNNLLGASRWHNRHYVRGNLIGTAALLSIARMRGIRGRDLGLSPQRAGAGARWGAATSGVVLVALTAAALPSGRGAWLRDARLAGMSGVGIAYHAGVRVPLGTVVWEETAFRAVLPVLLQRAMPGPVARAANSLLFGLWHVRPTLEALRLNGLPTGGGRGGAAVVGAVVAAALADLLLSRLQRTTGSLLAPALVHVASNSGGTVVAGLAGRARPAPGPVTG